SQVTPGAATVATTPPATTGTTIVDVTPSTQVSPANSTPTPTRNHDAMPRSRSQRGAEKTVESAFSWSASGWTTTCSTCSAASGGSTSGVAGTRRRENGSLIGGLGPVGGRASRG